MGRARLASSQVMGAIGHIQRVNWEQLFTESSGCN